MPAITGYPLPTVIDPPGSIGVCVPVPDDPGHRQAFLGAIYALTRWYSWHPDPAKHGKDAAAIWNPIYDSVAAQLAARDGCDAMPFAVRQNEESPCELEFSIDGGITWTEFANLLLCPTPVRQTRYNMDTDQVETSLDGGVTWTPTPDADPRRQVLQPPRGGDNVKCDSAANAIFYIHQSIDLWITNIEDFGNGLLLSGAVLSALSLLFSSASLLVGLASATAGAMIDAGADAINDFFTPEIYDTLLCIIFCSMNDDGSVDQAALDAINAAIDAQIGGLGALLLHYIMQLIGFGGLTDAGRIGTETGDCDCECAWCFRDDLSADDGDFTALTVPGFGGGTAPAAVYTPPWEAVTLVRDPPFTDQATFLHISRGLPAGRYTSIQIDYNVIFDVTGFTGEVDLDLYVGGTQVEHIANTAAGAQSILWTGDRTDLTGLNVIATIGFATGHAPAASMDLDVITYKGQDSSPFGDSNC